MSSFTAWCPNDVSLRQVVESDVSPAVLLACVWSVHACRRLQCRRDAWRLCLVSACSSASPVSTCCVALCMVSGHGRGVSQSALGGTLVNSLLRFYCLLHRHRSKPLARLCGVPTRQNSVTTSFEASCERLLSGSTAVVFDFDLLRASWSAGTPRLRCVRIDRPVFMSGGAFELSLFSSSYARDLQHWTWRLD